MCTYGMDSFADNVLDKRTKGKKILDKILVNV